MSYSLNKYASNFIAHFINFLSTMENNLGILDAFVHDEKFRNIYYIGIKEIYDIIVILWGKKLLTTLCKKLFFSV